MYCVGKNKPTAVFELMTWLMTVMDDVDRWC